MIVTNADRGTVLGEAIEVANTAKKRVRGLLGRDCLADGQGLLFRGTASLHTFFMQFPIDIVFMDRQGRVMKSCRGVKPFKLVMAPFKAHYALELPVGAINNSDTRIGDHLRFLEEEMQVAA